MDAIHEAVSRPNDSDTYDEARAEQMLALESRLDRTISELTIKLEDMRALRELAHSERAKAYQRLGRVPA